MKRGTHAAAWVLLAMTAFLLWPERWGGSMTYVITSGNSMAPSWAAGDLGVLRTAEDYAVGDVAAYQSEELGGRIVMHRIVEASNGVLRFKGDNNDFVDPDLVAQEQVLGGLLFRVPGIGQFLTWFSRPVNLGMTALALFLLLGDRREKQSAPAVPAHEFIKRIGVVRVDVPEGAVIAHVADAAELESLARRLERPVLQERTAAYVYDGSVLYRHSAAVSERPAEQRRGAGRDWNYDPHVAALPRPRRQPAPKRKSVKPLRIAS